MILHHINLDTVHANVDLRSLQVIQITWRYLAFSAAATMRWKAVARATASMYTSNSSQIRNGVSILSAIASSKDWHVYCKCERAISKQATEIHTTHQGNVGPLPAREHVRILLARFWVRKLNLFNQEKRKSSLAIRTFAKVGNLMLHTSDDDIRGRTSKRISLSLWSIMHLPLCCFFFKYLLNPLCVSCDIC